MYPFSPDVADYLKAAGWRPGRKVTTRHWESLLRHANNPVYPVVVEFLQEFGGLTIYHPNPGHPETDDRDICISPSIAAEHNAIEEDGLIDMNARAGCALCAIGTAREHHILLLMAADGRVFGAMSDLLWLFGMSGCDAIETLCTSNRWKHLHPPED